MEDERVDGETARDHEGPVAEEGRDGGVFEVNGEGEGGAAVVHGVVHGGARLEEELGDIIVPTVAGVDEGETSETPFSRAFRLTNTTVF